MMTLDVWPDRACYQPGEAVRLHIKMCSERATTLRLTISFLGNEVARFERVIAPDSPSIELIWTPPAIAPRGYGVDAELLNTDVHASTAFDVLEHWTQAPRYGFLTNFAPQRTDAMETMQALVRMHVNGLQFYDWMYRHDQLLPPADEYRDPLDRPLSLDTIRALIDAAHSYGMATLPYTAIYAASPEFYAEHPEWALYRADGKPFDFGDGFLYYMNPAAGAPWSEHLLDQFDAMLHSLKFDGVHIDQYGDPMAGRDAQGNPIALDRAIADFIDASVQRAEMIRKDASIIFNCVTNWPIEYVGRTRSGCMYIEVWKPFTLWHDLWRLIVEAQNLSGKPVVLAAYIDPAREHNVRLADAIIFASGGYHIELGEPHALLADPYFPKYGQISNALHDALRAYYDFAVRYENVLALDTRDATHKWAGSIFINGAAINIDRLSNAVWPIVREREEGIAISLINFSDIESMHWVDALTDRPLPLQSITVRVYSEHKIEKADLASPDDESPQATPATTHAGRDARGAYLDIVLPSLAWWTLIVLEWGS